MVVSGEGGFIMLSEKFARCLLSLLSNVWFGNRFGEWLVEDGFLDFDGCSKLAKYSSEVIGICILRGF